MEICISIAARPGTFGNRFHNFLYQELGLDFVYRSGATTDPEGALRGMRAIGIRGCGVSMPFKEQVIPFLDALDAEAREIGAVNTIVNAQGKLKGYNTDVKAVRELLGNWNAINPSHSRVVLQGSGGMAKAIGYALKGLKFKVIEVVSRNAQTGPALAQEIGGLWRLGLGAPETDLPLLLINATPKGMTPDPVSVISFPQEWVKSAQGVMDSVARPVETGLVRLARELDKPVITGFDITLIQGREQFVLYTGVKPSEDQLRRAALHASG